MYEWLRPACHFLPEKNWMNDPNGLCYLNGEYHLFYQHNPEADVWGDIHWGHAVSRDLIHWERLPIAFGPSRELGEKHCYSGSIAIQDGIARAFYTSVGEGARGPENGAEQWMAYSTDDLRTFTKDANHPVLSMSVHPNLRLTYWRDPFVFQGEDGLWYAVLSGTLDGVRGCMLLYASDDLRSWRFLQVLYQTGEYPLLECPNLIPIGDRYVMLYSPVAQIHYHVGTWTLQGGFVTERSGILDGGSGRHGFYAPATYMNLPGKRRVMMGWMSDKGRENQPDIRGWAGAQSLPREMTLEGSRLRVDFASECRILRQKEILDFRESLHAEGFQIGFALSLKMAADAAFTLTLLSTPKGDQRTLLRYDAAEGELRLEREASTGFDRVDVSVLCQPVALLLNGALELEIYVDGSIIEMCVNHEEMLTGRVYPSRPDACHHFLWLGGGAELLEAKAWQLERILD